MNAKFVLGIFGVSGCGKSTLSRYLVHQYQFSLIDLDVIGHDVLLQSQVVDKLVRCFGQQILKKTGSETIINRKVLGQCVFSNSDHLNQLNCIVHPALIALAKERLSQLTGPVVIDGALINDFGLNGVCDACVAVKASLADLILFTKPKQFQILASQEHIFKQVDQATYTIENNYEPLGFYQKIDGLLKNLNFIL